MQPFRFQKAYSPVLICNALGGALIPGDISDSMTDAGLQADANRLLIRFVDIPALERAAVITSNISRHVIDLDRPADQPSVVPTKNSTGAPIYRSAKQPSQTEIDDRIFRFHQPFHHQIAEELNRLVSQFGHAVLVDITTTAVANDPAVSVTIAGNAIPANLRNVLTRWQSAVAATHSATIDTTAGSGGEIFRRHSNLDKVTVIRVCLNESNFVDPFDGEFDFDTGRELRSTVEPLMQSIMRWASS